MWITLACAVPPSISPPEPTAEPPPAPPPAATTIDGREVLIHVPPAWDGTTALPLVLDLHGTGADGEVQRLLSGLEDAADEAGFLVVWPERPDDRPVSAWLLGCDSADVDYVAGLLDALADELRFDPDRVVATGVSNGGYFAHVLGAVLPDRIAAIAPVAAGPGLVASACPPAGALPVTIVHGTVDPIVPFTEGEAARDVWADAGACGDPSPDPDGCEVSACADGATLRFCPAAGAGHVDVYASYPTADRITALVSSL